MIKSFKRNFLDLGMDRQVLAFTQFALCCRACPRFGNAGLSSLEFEKKLCRSSLRQTFGSNLAVPATLRFGLAFRDQEIPKDHTQKTLSLPGHAHGRTGSGGRYENLSSSNFHFRYHPVQVEGHTSRLESAHGNQSFFKKSFVCSPQPLMSADWLMAELTQQLAYKKSTRAALNQVVRESTKLMLQLKSACPILGLRIVATGRLGKRKKGMAQQISRSVGKVPLSSFNHKVDYCQDFVTTPLGAVGLKVWICYAPPGA